MITKREKEKKEQHEKYGSFLEGNYLFFHSKRKNKGGAS